MVLSKKEMGEKIKQARKIKSKEINAKYTQNMLADDLRISRGYIGDIENGRTYPNYILLNKIADACGVPFSFFGDMPKIDNEVLQEKKQYFGKYLEELRIKAGYLDHDSLSKVSGVRSSTIKQLEEGKKPDDDVLFELSPFLNVSYKNLLVAAGLLDFEFHHKIAKRLIKFRIERGYSQKEIADYLKVPEEFYVDVEEERVTVSPKITYLLSEFYNIPEEYFLKDQTDNKETNTDKGLSSASTAIFCNRLTELRNEKALSQEELNNNLNLLPSTISKYENGEKEPDLSILAKLANFFDVSIDYLLGQTGIRNLEEASKILSKKGIHLPAVVDDKIVETTNAKLLSPDMQKSAIKLADSQLKIDRINKSMVDFEEIFKESAQAALKSNMEYKAMEIIDLIYSMRELSESDLILIESLVEHLKAKNKNNESSVSNTEPQQE